MEKKKIKKGRGEKWGKRKGEERKTRRVGMRREKEGKEKRKL